MEEAAQSHEMSSQEPMPLHLQVAPAQGGERALPSGSSSPPTLSSEGQSTVLSSKGARTTGCTWFPSGPRKRQARRKSSQALKDKAKGILSSSTHLIFMYLFILTILNWSIGYIYILFQVCFYFSLL